MEQDSGGGHGAAAHPSSAEALDYLRSFPDWELGTASSGETYTLERMRRLLGMLGHPDRAYPIVHVVGTKGKGSTAAMVASVLEASGYPCGLFTSPHLVEYRERVRVAGLPIPLDDLSAIVDEALRPAVDQLRAAGERTPLHFELWCALAFDYFRRRGVAVAVVEAGLGGRLDATNAVERTALTVVTTLGYDHMAVLGNTLTEIAAEKAAVIRSGGQVVSAPQAPEALVVLERVCREREAVLTLVGGDWRVERVREQTGGTAFDLLTAAGEGYRGLWVPLAGAHQAVNAATAVVALDRLRRRFPALDERAIRQGLAGVRWPGRLQTAARDPLVLLDGAHNQESASALASALRQLYPGARFVLVVAVFRDKDAATILAPLLPLAARVIATATDHPRALPAADLASRIRAVSEQSGTMAPVEEAPSVAAALDRARRLAGAGQPSPQEPSPPAPLPRAGQPSPPTPLPCAGEGSKRQPSPPAHDAWPLGPTRGPTVQRALPTAGEGSRDASSPTAGVLVTGSLRTVGEAMIHMGIGVGATTDIEASVDTEIRQGQGA